jgi:hypothetical protein
MAQRVATKFRVGDAVRFVGTDTVLTITQYNPKTVEYQVRRDEDAPTLEWVSGIYLEHT